MKQANDSALASPEISTKLGPLPEPDMCHEKARDDREEETSYSAEAMEIERQRCYELGREIGLQAAALAAQPDDSYQDEWFKAKADAVRRIRALMLPAF